MKRRTRLRTKSPLRRRSHRAPKKPVEHDQQTVCAAIAAVRAGETTVAQAARDAGCERKELARLVWEETRLDVLTRDGWCCALCPGTAGDVHHRRPRKSGGTSDPRIAYGMANLISVCRPCHAWIHGSRAEALEEGLLLEEDQIPAEVPVARRGGSVLLLDDGAVGPVPSWEES